LVLTANRGLCGGYNGNVLRLGVQRKKDLDQLTNGQTVIEVSQAWNFRIEVPWN
jgi:F0F1-type ATP synthase gamma subunit